VPYRLGDWRFNRRLIIWDLVWYRRLISTISKKETLNLRRGGCLHAREHMGIYVHGRRDPAMS
jgi:hypothetical protein